MHVGDGAHRGARSRQTPDQGGSHVADPLANEFTVRAVLGAGDVVGHQGGQQRVDRAQDGEGDGITAQQAEVVEAQLRPAQGRKPLGDGAQAGDGALGQQGAER